MAAWRAKTAMEATVRRACSFFDVVDRRRSVRAYATGSVPPEALEAILTVASAAPSAGNLQAYAIGVVDDPRTRSALAGAAYDQEFVANAPVILVFFADPARSAAKYGERGASLYCIQDATIATAHAQLAAGALDLASCWVGAFDEHKVGEILHAPPGLRAVAILPIGHPAEHPDRSARRPLEHLVHRGGF